MSYHELRKRRGDTWYQEFTVLQPDEVSPVNITGASFRFTAKADPDDADGDAIVSGTTAGGECQVTDAAAGVMTVKIPASATTSIAAPSSLYFDLQAEDSAGDVWTTAWGKIIVDRDISITVP